MLLVDKSPSLAPNVRVQGHCGRSGARGSGGSWEGQLSEDANWRRLPFLSFGLDAYSRGKPAVIFVHRRGKEPNKSLWGATFAKGLADAARAERCCQPHGAAPVVRCFERGGLPTLGTSSGNWNSIPSASK